MQTQPTQSIKPLNQRTKRWITGGALVASLVFLFLQTFILPNVPQIANGDQGIYLSLAARMLDGQMMYRDFDHFTLPGTSVLYLVVFKLFGVRAWIAPAMLIVLAFRSLGSLADFLRM